MASTERGWNYDQVDLNDQNAITDAYFSGDLPWSVYRSSERAILAKKYKSQEQIEPRQQQQPPKRQTLFQRVL